MTVAAERTSAVTYFKHSVQSVMARILAPEGEPISPPVPMLKPERNKLEQGVVAQCGYASILSMLAEDGETPIYRAAFDAGMVDAMADEGCAQFYQGCNVCTIRYDGCDAAVRAACTDAACLESKCERQVMCSAKRCEARGKPGGNAPGCTSRLVRTACRRTVF